MKKLLFVLAFSFIGQQAFSQMYIVTYGNISPTHPSNCSAGTSPINEVLTKIDPTGNVTYTCIENVRLYTDPSTIVAISQELNSIINQGYKLVYTSSTTADGAGGTFNQSGYVVPYTIWYFAIP